MGFRNITWNFSGLAFVKFAVNHLVALEASTLNDSNTPFTVLPTFDSVLSSAYNYTTCIQVQNKQLINTCTTTSNIPIHYPVVHL